VPKSAIATQLGMHCTSVGRVLAARHKREAREHSERYARLQTVAGSDYAICWNVRFLWRPPGHVIGVAKCK